MLSNKSATGTALAVALALTVGPLVWPAHAADILPTLVRATPRAQRLATLSDEARALVAELDGEARGAHLSVQLLQAHRCGTLLRVALEVQSVLHRTRSNYLYALYRALDAHHAENALVWAEYLAQMGVGIGMTTGHFENTTHIDASAPLPQSLPSDVASVPMSRWLDGFASARYRIGYRPFARGNLSEVVQLEYDDGTILDIDIRVISDNRDPAPYQAMARPYIGQDGRLFPLRLNRDTTPRLWWVKQRALAAMHQSNREFETTVAIGLAAIMTNMPIGLVVPVSAPSAPSPRVVRAPRSARISPVVKPARPSAPRQTQLRTRARPQTKPQKIKPQTESAAKAPATATKPAAVPAPTQAKVPTSSRIVRRTSAAPLARTAGPRFSWPPRKPTGLKPAVHEANAASWRYQRYVYKAYKNGTPRVKILPYRTWRRRYFEPVLRGGRPGRPGGPAHQADVKRNKAAPNRLKVERVGTRFPDGVGRRGQTVVIRGQTIAPRSRARVIVESDHLIRSGTMPDSAARAQVRDIRKAEPDAIIVVTDQSNPGSAPLIYPPGKQPPPPGRMPVDQAPVVSYP